MEPEIIDLEGPSSVGDHPTSEIELAAQPLDLSLPQRQDYHQELTSTMRGDSGSFISPAQNVRSEDPPTEGLRTARPFQERRALKIDSLMKSNARLRRELDRVTAMFTSNKRLDVRDELQDHILLRREIQALKKDILGLKIKVGRQSATINQQVELLRVHSHLVKTCYICHYRLIGWHHELATRNAASATQTAPSISDATDQPGTSAESTFGPTSQ